jgi:DNA polymerase-3 subunit delta'
MAFGHILGQEQAVQQLQHALSSGRLAHAYLFYGLSGTGKKLTALQFVKTLYCLSMTTDACDTCQACRRIATGNHPDVMMIGAAGTSIRIEHIRTLQHRLSYKPYENQRLSIIIDGCEWLSPPAANALLKTLEEPPANTLLLLLTGNKEALPVTIVSRCQLVPFRRLLIDHIRAILTQQGIDTATATLMATLSEGRLDTFTQHNFSHALASRQKAHTLLTNAAGAHVAAEFMQARQLAGKREACEELLHWLTLLCRDLVTLKVTPTRVLYNDDLRADLIELAHRLALDSLLEAFACIAQLRTYLRMNLNPQLVFERLLLQLEQLLAS